MNSKINVLFLDNTYTFGGAINSLQYLLRGLDKRKYKAILVSVQPKRYLDNNFKGIMCIHTDIKLQWVNNRIYKAAMRYRISNNPIIKKIITLCREIFWLFFIYTPEALTYYKIGRKYNINVVHLNNIFQLPGVIAAKLLRVKCVGHIRDFVSVSTSTRFIAKHVDHHIAVSTAIKNNLIDLGVEESKISLIFDSLDLDEFDKGINIDYLYSEFGISREKLLFGIFGRIVGWKGIKEFIIASCEVIHKHPEAKAFIIGGISDGNESYLTEIKELVDRSGMSKNIIFTGYRADIPAMMKLMDVVVHASIVPEPFGMVVIEAMAMGKPVIATKAGGPMDSVVDGKTGFLVHMKDTKQMANAIVKLLENPTLAGEMGRNGRKRTEEIFCKERYANQVEEVYASLLARILP